MLFTAILRSIVRNGSLCVIDSAGRRQTIGDGSPPEATLRLTSKTTEYTLALNPALSLGEAYMDGRLVIEEGSLYGFLDVVVRNYGATWRNPWVNFLERLGKGLKQANTAARARHNVAHHYDLSSDFYGIFLDRDRQYSCAYFKSPTDTLSA
jgi:cyclopropane-fatty-acyl-phospholipid synthase